MENAIKKELCSTFDAVKKWSNNLVGCFNNSYLDDLKNKARPNLISKEAPVTPILINQYKRCSHFAVSENVLAFICVQTCWCFVLLLSDVGIL